MVKRMENNPNIMNPHYNEHIFTIPWHFVILGFHCDTDTRGIEYQHYEGVLITVEEFMKFKSLVDR